MDTRNKYSEIIQKIIISYTDSNIKFKTVFDTQQDRYLLMIIGREKISSPFITTKRVDNCLIQVDIIDDKIVLAFYEPQIREKTGFAVA